MPRAPGLSLLPYQVAVIAAAMVALLADLALSRLILISHLDGATIVPGLLSFHFAWNKGVSFSLFWQSTAFGSWALGLFRTAVAFVLLYWAVTTDRVMLAASFAMISAGAFGNVVSRALYGAVFDFFALHLGRVPLFVFNISDILISAGVAGLVVEILWRVRFDSRVTS
jgi:signal peptidase II